MPYNFLQNSWKMWSDYLQYYKDPHLVARVQEYFGIEIHYENDSSNTEKSEIEISGRNEKNGLNDVKSNPLINGIAVEENEDTIKHRHKDKFKSSSDKATSASQQTNVQPFTIKNHFWYYLFLFGTELGDEIFYMVFIPFWLWNVDSFVGRRIITVWTIVMAVGQILKDIICWPRPSCPPAVRLQKKWSVEYGMPSTHAMVAICIPFSALFFTKHKYLYSFPIGFTIAVLWCTLICVSRVYLGMHTVLDVIAGLALAIIMMFILVPIVDLYDDYFVTNSWAMLALLIICIVTIVYYPTGHKWTPTRDDTTIVLSTGSAIHLGFWINYKTGALTKSLIPPPYNIVWPTYQMLGKLFARTILGFTYVILMKVLLKSLTCTVICAILKVNAKELKQSENSLENKNKILVQLAQKFVYGFVISCSLISVLPKIFTMAGIERPAFDTEL